MKHFRGYGAPPLSVVMAHPPCPWTDLWGAPQEDAVVHQPTAIGDREGTALSVKGEAHSCCRTVMGKVVANEIGIQDLL